MLTKKIVMALLLAGSVCSAAPALANNRSFGIFNGNENDNGNANGHCWVVIPFPGNVADASGLIARCPAVW